MRRVLALFLMTCTVHLTALRGLVTCTAASARTHAGMDMSSGHHHGAPEHDHSRDDASSGCPTVAACTVVISAAEDRVAGVDSTAPVDHSWPALVSMTSWSASPETPPPRS